MLTFEIAIILLITLICYINLNYNYNLYLIILSAFFIRIVFIIIDLYLYNIPFNSLDSNGYEHKADVWSEFGLYYAISNIFIEGKSFFYANFITIFYSIFGKSIFLAKLLSSIVSLLTILLVYKIINLIWANNNSAIYSLLFLAFSPIFILISTFTLREIYSIFFLLLAIYFYLKYEKSNYIFFFYLSLIISFVHIYIHGPMALVIFSLIFAYYFSNIFKIIKKEYNSINSFFFTNSILIIIFLILFYSNIVPSIPYLGDLTNLIDLLEIAQKLYLNTGYGRTAYSEMFYPDSYFLLIVLTPLRVFSLFCGPFMFDNLFDLLAILEGLIYFYLLSMIIINLKAIIKNKHMISLLIIILPIIIIYSWGINNYGTALRHKAKFLPLLLIICSPFIMYNLNTFKYKIRKLFFN